MELESALPCSQLPATGSYPEPDESSPHPPTLFPLRLIQTFSYLHLGLPSGCSLPNTLCAFLISPIRATCPIHVTFLNFITLIIFDDAY
jgi:hypothetical protein